MPSIKIDPSIERVTVGDFQFPLGVYPVEEMKPKPGYVMHFEPADGGPEGEGSGERGTGSGGGDEFGGSGVGDHDPDVDAAGGRGFGPRGSGGGGGAKKREERDEADDFGDADRSEAERGAGSGAGGEWEEWPDRYAYDIVISAERLPTLCRSLFMLLPGRVFPILDVLGQDAYREIDPYIAYDLVGLDLFLDGVREFGEFLYEDGMCGFGVMSEDPFLYVFIDEHKVVTVRAQPELKERVERVLHAFDLEMTESAAGADAAAHEHRSVLIAPPDRPELWTPEQVVEELQDRWRMLLNVDPDTNSDDAGHDLGITTWRALVRCEYETGPVRYAEAVFDAENLRQAERVAFTAIEDLTDREVAAGKPSPSASTTSAPASATAGKKKDAEEDTDDWRDAKLVIIDRITSKQLSQVLAQAGLSVEDGKLKPKPKPGQKALPGKTKPGKVEEPTTQSVGVPSAGRVYFARWLDGI